jgi:hypothetical protein
MLNTLQGLSLLTAVEIVGPLLVAIAIAYDALRAGRRPRGAVERESERITQKHYREEH